MAVGKIVVCASSYDRATCIAREYARFCIQYAENLGRQLIKLLDHQANKSNVQTALGDSEVVGFDGYGHGSPTIFYGQSNNSEQAVLLHNSESNTILLKAKGAEVLACYMARGLGPESILITTCCSN